MNVDVDLKIATGKAQSKSDPLSHQLFSDFAEALTLRDIENLKALRNQLIEAVGEAGLVDAVAVAAAFHGNVRIADATGAPPEKGPGAEILEKSANELGLNDYYGMTEH